MSERSDAGAGHDLRRDILTTLLPGFDGTEAPEWLLGMLEDGLGGVCIFGQNIADAAQLRTLNASLRSANPLAVIAIDEEGGDVTRLFYDRGAPYPGNALLGRIDDLELTASVARSVGEALAATGCTVTFAPDVDVNSNADNPVIGVRSFGADAALVARHAAAWVRGLQQTGIAASAKHFPGHGDTAEDSHLALPVVDVSLDELRARELVPFRAAIAAGARTIMTSHLLLSRIDREHPATLSPRLVRGLLREELAFDGVIVTDALDMAGASGERGIPEAAVQALVAGCDLLCIGSDNTERQLDEIVAAVEVAVASGRLPAGRVRDAAARVRALATFPLDVSGRTAEGEASAATEAELLDRLAAAFEVSDVARARLSAASGHGTIVRVDTEASIAVGSAPWGPFAAAVHSPDVSAALGAIVVLEEGRAIPDAASLAGPVLVVGRDLHRHPFAVAAVDALRSVRDDVVVIDMGWPSHDRSYADIATFGASRLVGQALLRLLGILNRTGSPAVTASVVS
ncbi:glycoside hydrolase family 3 protein [Agromyces sp. Marseille-P2726]|uniref:glycoside hydrolase family 3 protein n=1 Tax=Agromyces sp. Marseille-P2726 TaxID=2709132 RepID=UPI0015711D20|nr:glycoside hydrolase family 3 N-terminal domain-containing protein [Agromyces sp. Marseille-P2726]